MMTADDSLRYPIGRFTYQPDYSESEIKENISQIAELPEKVKALTESFSNEDWDRPYRPEGWTARQVLHHLADSHVNSYMRFKWTLTEEIPIIKTYNEKLWAQTPENELDTALSLHLLTALHKKWISMLNTLTPEMLSRTFYHPDSKRHISLKALTALYAWHGNHHFNHLKLIANKS